ncbi:Mut7-C RNAse domain protein [Marine Group I thaumarchaeote SCGC AAA799-E16]|uniref:Mut7-C RNAse domain protein n=4 Tax=Marine Group I TaxID=905826 RepID=A0A087S951_9ARCH|nr:Mut7-C RNAse domain protein [Marine Group I thaumarchaeote SCGC AAA799-N04]KER06552.1 Mut7-C RNAse domain protein [Marine Group I thaumarchaeote SCGC AAA799-E16]KFM18484.1 Mut7-C RNAse domain protein [Marine Group I thaumarchaeote SCGC RSA3]KFM22255.1 Mut7-C RNAse domain protein [Marine Group I thaumarchaeote SCGC AAA799-B03]
MLFIVDAMLGNVAKKLRLLGFDAEYLSDVDDSVLIEKSKNENRVIITKDNELTEKAKKNGLSVVYIAQENEIEQFLEILKQTNLKLNGISGDVARCTKCNSLTYAIEKSKISQNVSQGVLENNDRFWKCKNCDQIYWEGTHIKNLQKFVKKLKTFG